MSFETARFAPTLRCEVPLHTCLEKPSLGPLLAEVVFLEGQRLWRRVRRRRHPAPAVAAEIWSPPDSRLCDQARELCEAHSSRALVGHCARTYSFGMALSGVLGRAPDRELLYIAAQLHDLGLTPSYAGDRPFELRGADAAYKFCREHDVPEAKAELVHDAISLHTSLVAARREPEVALVHFGAGVDVIGYRVEDVAPRTLAAILEVWPRAGMKSEIHALLRQQARTTPDSPLGLQWRLGFGKRILAAPFDE